MVLFRTVQALPSSLPSSLGTNLCKKTLRIILSGIWPLNRIEVAQTAAFTKTQLTIVFFIFLP